jgi:hypothetical protein
MQRTPSALPNDGGQVAIAWAIEFCSLLADCKIKPRKRRPGIKLEPSFVALTVELIRQVEIAQALGQEELAARAQNS